LRFSLGSANNSISLSRNTFTQAERLKSAKTIGELFDKGDSVDAFPIRIIYLPTQQELPFPAQATFSASKRNFPRAVERNRVKRLMREAYRLQKPAFYAALQEKKKQIALMFLFTGKKLPEYKLVETNLSAALQLLKERL
jgi:ribonuclease P protein component